MSAQGGTIARGTIHLPMWPVAAVLAAMVATAIGLTVIDDAARQGGQVTTTREAEGYWSPTTGHPAVRGREAVGAVPAINPAGLESASAAVREAGATLPVIVGISHVAPSLHASTGYAGFENPAATYIREASGYAGFENPAAYGTVAWGSIGGPNEALHRQYSPPRDGAPQTGPITINGQACMQCR